MNPPILPKQANNSLFDSWVAIPGMMVWYDRLLGPTQLGWLSLSEKLHPLFYKVNEFWKKNSSSFQVNLFKINNCNTRKKYEMCSKVTIKIPERHWCCGEVFVANFQHKFRSSWLCKGKCLLDWLWHNVH